MPLNVKNGREIDDKAWLHSSHIQQAPTVSGSALEGILLLDKMQLFIYSNALINHAGPTLPASIHSCKKARTSMSETFTAALPETEQLQRAADILKTVAHPLRLRIIDLLEQGERAVMEICSRLGAPQPSISQHLNIMKARGILASHRNGNQVYYSIANRNVVKIIHCVRRHGEVTVQDGTGCVVDPGTKSE